MKRILALIVVLTVFLTGCGKDKGAELVNSVDLSKQPFTFVFDYRDSTISAKGTYIMDPTSKTATIKTKSADNGIHLTAEIKLTDKGAEPISLEMVDNNGNITKLDSMNPSDVDAYLQQVKLTSFDEALEMVQENLDIVKEHFEKKSTLKGDRYEAKYDIKDGGKIVGSSNAYVSTDGKKITSSYNAIGQGRQEYTLTLN